MVNSHRINFIVLEHLTAVIFFNINTLVRSLINKGIPCDYQDVSRDNVLATDWC